MEKKPMVYTPKPGWTKARSYMRFDIETPAKILVLSHEGEVLYKLDLLTKNICAGGAFFQMRAPLAGGTRVKIEMNLAVDRLKPFMGEGREKGFHLLVHGTVVRSVPEGMAVGFDDEYEIFPFPSTQGS